MHDAGASIFPTTRAAFDPSSTFYLDAAFISDANITFACVDHLDAAIHTEPLTNLSWIALVARLASS